MRNFKKLFAYTYRCSKPIVGPTIAFSLEAMELHIIEYF